VIERALMKKARKIKLEQRHKAESDIARGANNQRVFDSLVSTLNRMGAVVSGGIDRLASSLDAVDGRIGDIKTRLQKLEQRERNGRNL
jgi:hypothetical protein